MTAPPPQPGATGDAAGPGKTPAEKGDQPPPPAVAKGPPPGTVQQINELTEAIKRAGDAATKDPLVKKLRDALVAIQPFMSDKDAQSAIDFPRAFFERRRTLVERGVPRSTVEGLEARGHEVRLTAAPWGGGQAIRIDWDQGTLTGGSDPRKDGAALGY